MVKLHNWNLTGVDIFAMLQCYYILIACTTNVYLRIYDIYWEYISYDTIQFLLCLITKASGTQNSLDAHYFGYISRKKLYSAFNFILGSDL